MRKCVPIAAAASLLLAVSPAAAATVVHGSPSPTYADDCTPSCSPQLQTVYSHTLFGSAPVEISAITYFGQSWNGSNAQTYTIRLSTSANAVGSLSTNFAANVGSDVALFYSGVPTVPSTFGAFTFNGTPFLYNPNQGDLLVDMYHDVSDEAFYSSYEGFTGEAQRVFSLSNTGDGYTYSSGYAIATQFTVGAPAVPEPATWAMMIGGFALAGGAMRRRAGQSALRLA